METLTPQQQRYIKQWNNNKFYDVLSKIENGDLKKIAPYVDLGAGYNWWNQEVCVYSCVSNQVRNNDQWKILLEADYEGKLVVSDKYNKKLAEAIINNDREMIDIIVSHPRFNYYGTGSFNTRYWSRDDLTMTNDLVRHEKFFELLDCIKYLYGLLNDNDKPKLVTDIFTAINKTEKYQYVAECLKVFT